MQFRFVPTQDKRRVQAELQSSGIYAQHRRHHVGKKGHEVGNQKREGGRQDDSKR